MISHPNRLAISFALAFFLLFLSMGLAVQAGTQDQPGGELSQDTYPYPEETYPTDPPYPWETQFTSTPTVENPLLLVTPTLEITVTPEVNLFGTENAEMQDTLGTQSASATPAPSITPINTQTSIVQVTETLAPASMEGNKKGFGVDWGYFWIGFAIPVMLSCGVVLYLLDRRPDLFTQRPKL